MICQTSVSIHQTLRNASQPNTIHAESDQPETLATDQTKPTSLGFAELSPASTAIEHTQLAHCDVIGVGPMGFERCWSSHPDYKVPADLRGNSNHAAHHAYHTWVAFNTERIKRNIFFCGGGGAHVVWKGPDCPKTSIFQYNSIDIMFKLFIIWGGLNHDFRAFEKGYDPVGSLGLAYDS